MPDVQTIAVVAGLALLGGATVWLLWLAYSGWKQDRQVQGQLDQISRSGRRAAQGEEEQQHHQGLWSDEEAEGKSLVQQLLLRLPRAKDLQHFLEQANSRLNATAFVGVTIGMGASAALVVYIMAASPWPALLVGPVGALAPYFVIRRKREKRIEQFEEHFPDAIDLLNRSIRAGHAFSTGLQVVAEESPQPVSGEFRQVFEEQKYGLPLRDSLLAMGDRIDTVDVRMFVTSVLIQRESGGNLAENLENLAELIRDRFQFERDVQTKTAHGRITGLVLGLAPIGAGLGMWLIAPDYMAPLWETELGRLMLLGTVVWMGVGFWWIQRLVDLDY